MENLNKTFEEIQEIESVNSIKSFEKGEVKSTKRDIEEEEEILEKEIALIKKKLEKEERKEANRDVSMQPLPQNQLLATSNPFAAAAAPMDLEAEIREIQNRLNNLSRERQIYPVVKTIDLQEQRIRQHNPLAFKDIKQ